MQNPFFEKAQELKSMGYSLKKIGDELGMSKSSVHRLLNEGEENETEKEAVSEINENSNKFVKTSKQVSNEVNNPKLIFKLKKLELEHQKSMKELEFEERERERQFELEKIEKNQSLLKMQRELEDLKQQKQILLEQAVEDEEIEGEYEEQDEEVDDEIELPEKIQNEVRQTITEILKERDSQWDRNDIETWLSNIEVILKRISKFCKSESVDRTEFMEWTILKQIRQLFLGMNEELSNRSGFFASSYISLEIPDELDSEIAEYLE